MTFVPGTCLVCLPTNGFRLNRISSLFTINSSNWQKIIIYHNSAGFIVEGLAITSW